MSGLEPQKSLAAFPLWIAWRKGLAESLPHDSAWHGRHRQVVKEERKSDQLPVAPCLRGHSLLLGNVILREHNLGDTCLDWKRHSFRSADLWHGQRSRPVPPHSSRRIPSPLCSTAEEDTSVSHRMDTADGFPSV